MTFLLALSLLASSLDRAQELIENEEFAPALELLEKGEGDRFRDLRNRAIRGVSRDLQRAEGYAPAVDYLEKHLETRFLVAHYVEVCLWSGQEDRALRTLKALPPDFRHECAYAEFQIHFARLDFAALEQRAKEVSWPEWVAFAKEQRELREGFDERTSRAWTVFWVALGAMIAIVTIAWRAARTT